MTDILPPEGIDQEPRFLCTVCGMVGSVGRCCGRDTRKPLNEAARLEILHDEQREKNQ